MRFPSGIVLGGQLEILSEYASTKIPICQFLRGGQLANLLETLCTQFDWHLDRETTSDKPQTNLADEGINNPRGKALKDLINFGFWLRRHDLESESREVTKILENASPRIRSIR